MIPDPGQIGETTAKKIAAGRIPGSCGSSAGQEPLGFDTPALPSCRHRFYVFSLSPLGRLLKLFQLGWIQLIARLEAIKIGDLIGAHADINSELP